MRATMLLIAVTADGRSPALDWDPGTGVLHRKNRRGLATPRQNPTKQTDRACGVNAQGASKVKFSTFPDFSLFFQPWVLK